MKKTALLFLLLPALTKAQTYSYSVSQNDSCPPLNMTITNLTTDPNAYIYHWFITGEPYQDTLDFWDTLTTSFTPSLNISFYNSDSGFIQISMAVYDSAGNFLGGMNDGNVAYIHSSDINFNVTPDSCTGGVGVAEASGCCGYSPYTYAWSDGSTSSTITGLYEGTYAVTMTDAGGCTTIDSVIVSTSSYTLPAPICIVSVDSSTKKNTIIWEKLNDAKIISYNIYKETTTAGVYSLIGNSPVSNLSIFTDSLSDPAQNAARYKISSLDTCGNESAKSAAHKTIHLTIGLGVPPAINLNWDNYEGINFGEYYIWRGNAFGNLILIDTIQSSLNSYTDQNPPPGTNFYAIQIVHPQGCNATYKSPAFYSSSFSNIENNGASVIINDVKKPLNIRALPNPTSGKATITGMNAGSIEVYNLPGEKILCLIAGVSGLIDLSSQPDGIYIIKVISGNNTSYQRLIKQQ